MAVSVGAPATLVLGEPVACRALTVVAVVADSDPAAASILFSQALVDPEPQSQ